MNLVEYQVLVVEDALVPAKLAEAVLKDLGCTVTIADTGAKALELALNKPYHLILMDLGLPDIDGLIVTEQLRQREGVNQHAPIVVLTSHSADYMEAKARSAGADFYIVKPFSAQIILPVLQRYGYKAVVAE